MLSLFELFYSAKQITQDDSNPIKVFGCDKPLFFFITSRIFLASLITSIQQMKINDLKT